MKTIKLGALWVSFAALALAGCTVNSTTNNTDDGNTASTGSNGNTTSGGAGGGSSTASTTSGNSNTTTGGSPQESLVGAACTKDADCGDGLTCATAEADHAGFEGGAAGGYCTKSCSGNDDCDGASTCAELLPGAEKVCLRTCTVGPALTALSDELDAEKCFGRDELACQPTSVDSGMCIPSCHSTSDCGSGRACDPRSTVCKSLSDIAPGKAVGEPCQPLASGADPRTDECSGFCIPFGGENPGICAQGCTLGGGVDDCGGPDNGLCAFTPIEEAGPGEQGACTRSCKTQDDCPNPDMWCFDLGYPNNGFCFPSKDCSSNPDVCAVYRATCTETKHGSFCLSAKYELGSAGPDASTAGAGGAGGASSGTGGAGGGG